MAKLRVISLCMWTMIASQDCQVKNTSKLRDRPQSESSPGNGTPKREAQNRERLSVFRKRFAEKGVVLSFSSTTTLLFLLLKEDFSLRVRQTSYSQVYPKHEASAP